MKTAIMEAFENRILLRRLVHMIPFGRKTVCKRSANEYAPVQRVWIVVARVMFLTRINTRMNRFQIFYRSLQNRLRRDRRSIMQSIKEVRRQMETRPCKELHFSDTLPAGRRMERIVRSRTAKFAKRLIQFMEIV